MTYKPEVIEKMKQLRKKGHTVREIAWMVGVSRDTVSKHVTKKETKDSIRVHIERYKITAKALEEKKYRLKNEQKVLNDDIARLQGLISSKQVRNNQLETDIVLIEAAFSEIEAKICMAKVRIEKKEKSQAMNQSSESSKSQVYSFDYGTSSYVISNEILASFKSVPFGRIITFHDFIHGKELIDGARRDTMRNTLLHFFKHMVGLGYLTVLPRAHARECYRFERTTKRFEESKEK